jgi:hypothetical protein
MAVIAPGVSAKGVLSRKESDRCVKIDPAQTPKRHHPVATGTRIGRSRGSAAASAALEQHH